MTTAWLSIVHTRSQTSTLRLLMCALGAVPLGSTSERWEGAGEGCRLDAFGGRGTDDCAVSF